MSNHAALAADLRQRINPAYAAQRGTESYERLECAEAIEELIALNAELLSALKAVLSVANVRIDDSRIGVFDAARAAIAKATKGEVKCPH